MTMSTTPATTRRPVEAGCGHDNPPFYRFCGRCGDPLQRTACVCGFVAAAIDAHCGGCGRALGAVEAVPPRAGLPVPDRGEAPADSRLDLSALAGDAAVTAGPHAGGRADGTSRTRLGQEDVRRLFASRKPRD